MKILILQHEKSTPPGSTLKWCTERGHEFRVLTPSETAAWPALAEFDLMVICGGGMNVDQEAQYPWLRGEKAFIRSAIAAGKKIAGLCLGGQLLSEALGGVVDRHTDWTVGWHKVQISTGEELVVFQWHGYRFSLPAGAERIASNPIWENQAFSYRGHVLGFQFHPETTIEWALECADHPRLPQTGWVQSRDEIKRDLKFQPALQAWYFKQLDRLLNSK